MVKLEDSSKMHLYRDTSDIVESQIINSYLNFMNGDSPDKLLAEYVVTGKTMTGTLIDRLLKCGVSPIIAALHKPRSKGSPPQDGVIDSLRQLVYSENNVKLWSYKFLLASLLTKVF